MTGPFSPAPPLGRSGEDGVNKYTFKEGWQGANKPATQCGDDGV